MLRKVFILSGILACLVPAALSGQETLPGEGYTLQIISADGKRVRVVGEETLVRLILKNGTGLQGYLGFRNDSVILVDSAEVRLSDIRMIQYNNRKKLLTGTVMTVAGPLLFLVTAFTATPGSTLIITAAIVSPALLVAGVAVLVSNNIARRIGKKWTLSVHPGPPPLHLPGELPAVYPDAPD